MPVMPPRAQLSGSGFGQFGSYWYCGGPSALDVGATISNTALQRQSNEADAAKVLFQSKRIVLVPDCCADSSQSSAWFEPLEAVPPPLASESTAVNASSLRQRVLADAERQERR